MTVTFRAGTIHCKNDIQREITQRQHEVELQFLHTVLPNILTNKHTKFQVISPKDNEVLYRSIKKCYEIEVKLGNKSKFVLGSYGSCAMHYRIFQQSCISNLKMLRL